MALPEPVSAWNFDESSGNCADSKGSNTLTNNNSMSYVAGLIGNAANVVAASDKAPSITAAAQSGLIPVGSFTFNAWYNFKSNPNNTSSHLFSQWVGTGSRSMLISFDNYSGDPPQITCYISPNSSTFYSCNYINTFSTNTWYMFTFVFTSSTKIELFINGSSVASNSTSIPAAVYQSGTGAFAFGSSIGGGDGVDLNMDMGAFFSQALTGAEITELYNSGAGKQYPYAAAFSRAPSMFSVL